MPNTDIVYSILILILLFLHQLKVNLSSFIAATGNVNITLWVSLSPNKGNE